MFDIQQRLAASDATAGAHGLHLAGLRPLQPWLDRTATGAFRRLAHADRRRRSGRRVNPFGWVGAESPERRSPGDRRAVVY